MLNYSLLKFELSIVIFRFEWQALNYIARPAWAAGGTMTFRTQHKPTGKATKANNSFDPTL